MRTKVIELYGAPGNGKSTTAAELYVLMKKRKHKVELVRERIKTAAWRGENNFLDFSILSAQYKEESELYGFVDYIITDAPILNPYIFSEFYQYRHLTIDNPYKIIIEQLIENSNADRFKVFIPKHKEYLKHGRKETEEQTNSINKLIEKLFTFDIKSHKVDEIYNKIIGG